MFKTALIKLFVTTSLLLAIPISQAPAHSRSQDLGQTPPPLLTFSDLKRNDSITGPFVVVGFVMQTYKCPPCPPRAMCKPCLGDHIVVTDHPDEKDPARIQRLTIFTDKPEQFKVDNKYSFTVRPRGRTAPGHPLEEVDLISFEPVKEQHHHRARTDPAVR
jgi:hypothetical protein